MNFLFKLIFAASLAIVATSQYPGCTTILDIGFLLDASGSIGQADYDKARDAVISLVTNFNVAPGRIHFGLINFHTTPSLITGFIASDQDKQVISSKIRAIKYTGGMTGTVSALKLARSQLFNVKRDINTPRIAIVLTDGYSTDGGKLKVKEEADGLRKLGVEVFSIGVGSLNPDELQAMASYPQNVVLLKNYQEVAASINMITQKACEANSFLSFSRKVGIHTETENRFFVTQLETLDPSYEFVELEVTQKNGRVNVYCSTKEKNPDESNTRAAIPVRSVQLKNGWTRNTYWYIAEEGDQNFFYTIQGLTASNDADIVVEKNSFAKVVREQIEESMKKSIV